MGLRHLVDGPQRSPLLVVLLLLLGLPVGIRGQDVTIHGQIRPRLEARDPGPGGSGESFTSMRLRAAIRARLQRGISAYVEVQDVRVFGEEASTLTDYRADNLDLHQGYIHAALGTGGWFSVQAGRQETALGGERLVGPVGWTQQGRSFDGLRVTGRRGGATVEVLAYVLSETDRTDRTDDAELLGLHGSLEVPGGALDLYGLLNTRSGTADTDQGTVGLRYHGDRGGWIYRAEATAQRGTRIGEDVSAHMVGVRAGRSLRGGDASLTLWWDYLSGDDDPDDEEVRVFDTLFGTNHKFYGFADVFLDIPRDTGGRGLHDLAVKGMHRLGERGRANVDVHRFRAASTPSGATSDFGTEVDVTLSYRYTEELGLSGGFSYVFAADGLEDVGRLAEDMTFSYLMVDLRF